MASQTSKPPSEPVQALTCFSLAANDLQIHYISDITILSRDSFSVSARLEIITAVNISIQPAIILGEMRSCNIKIENIVPNTDSIDKIIADFVSSTYFWQAV